MLETTIDGLSKFKANVMYDQTGTIDSVIAMVNNLKTMHDSFGPEAAVSEEKLGKALRDLCNKGRYVSYVLWGESDKSKVGPFHFTYAPRMLVS